MNIPDGMKTAPMAHQAEDFERSAELPGFAFFWQTGCGKTKPVIDTAAHLYAAGKIDSLLVFATPTVAGNWIDRELPTHCGVPWEGTPWISSRSGTKSQKESEEAVVRRRNVLTVAAMGYEAAMTKAGQAFVTRLLKERRCLFAADESAKLKTPSARRTIAFTGRSRQPGLIHRAPYRRILSGTPITRSPFDIYSQMRVVDPNYWTARGIASFAAFKQRYAIWESKTFGARTVQVVKEYRNLDELTRYVREFGSRRLKSECLDLPPKTYVRREFDLTPAQRAIYDDVRRGREDRHDVSVAIAATRALRLQQIASGWLPREGEDRPGSIPQASGLCNPRLAELLAVVDECEDQQVIVWANFTADIDLICHTLAAEAISFVRIDGSTPVAARSARVAQFQSGAAHVFVGHPAAAGEGITLTAAQVVVNYSHGHRYDLRVQAEDRAHRIGQHWPVTYVDLIARETVDVPIIEALVEKHVDASTVLGDPEHAKVWL